MDKSQLLEKVRSARLKWDAALAQVADDNMLQPGFCGDWSGKDVIAHITWHEREMVGLLQAHALVGSHLWSLPYDQRNAAIFEQNKNRSLEDVLGEAQQVYPTLMQWLGTLSEEDINDPDRFPDMPTDWQPWKVIAGNTYEHYEDHLPQVQAWLSRPSRT